MQNRGKVTRKTELDNREFPPIFFDTVYRVRLLLSSRETFAPTDRADQWRRSSDDYDYEDSIEFPFRVLFARFVARQGLINTATRFRAPTPTTERNFRRARNVETFPPYERTITRAIDTSR